MQNEQDPLRRITVSNAWAEANLMQTLRIWREQAEQRGFSRIAELADYLQADELTHVKLATTWIRQRAHPAASPRPASHLPSPFRTLYPSAHEARVC